MITSSDTVFRIGRRALLSVLTAVPVLLALPALAQTGAANPLPSWNDTATRKAIVTFVERVTKPGSPDLVPPAERIATFDNDGTLCAEQPIYFQVAFALDRVKALDTAQAMGWTVVDMKNDWKQIFPFGSK
jgi:hypothetical protein